MKRERFN